MPAKFIHQVTTSGLDLPVGIKSDTWRLEMDRPDGLKHLTVFPTGALVWRVAEYGFGPKDLDTILDILIHEQFMDFNDPDDLPTLLTATHQQEAREAHLERIKRIKANHTEVVPHGDLKRAHPLQIIRNNHGITDRRVQECMAVLIGGGGNHDLPKRHLPPTAVPLNKNQGSSEVPNKNVQVIVSP